MDLLGKKIIQPSSSEWAAVPVICMKKESGQYPFHQLKRYLETLLIILSVEFLVFVTSAF
jgi:hypothetical protein